jgi:hypothetical protein
MVFCTVICELIEDDATDAIIMEYIYERHKRDNFRD